MLDFIDILLCHLSCEHDINIRLGCTKILRPISNLSMGKTMAAKVINELSL